MVARTGSAVYVYGVILAMGWPDHTNLSFYIDNEPAGVFFNNPTFLDYPVYHYNTLLYSNTSLSYSSHSLDLVNVYEGGSSIVLLDYIIYSRSAQL